MNTCSHPLFYLSLEQSSEEGTIIISLLEIRNRFRDSWVFARGTGSDVAELGPPAWVLCVHCVLPECEGCAISKVEKKETKE